MPHAMEGPKRESDVLLFSRCLCIQQDPVVSRIHTTSIYNYERKVVVMNVQNTVPIEQSNNCMTEPS